MCVQNGAPNFGCVRAMGYLLLITSILAISLTIADILVTCFLCPSSGNGDTMCLPDYSNNVWTWIASGIWTSVPVFVLGLWVIAWSFTMSKPGCFQSWFLSLVYFLLVPMMISLTIVEIYKYRDHHLWSNGQFDKLPIPITLAIIGFIEFIICVFLYIETFCRNWNDIEYIDERHTTEGATVTQSTTSPTPVAPAAQVNYVYPNVAYTARMQKTIVPAYGIYSPKVPTVVQPTKWNSPALLYWPQNRIAVNGAQ